MELDTYRYYGHSMSDPGKSYRDASEIKEVRLKRDPITRVEDRALEGNLATEQELKEVNKQAKAEVKEAIEFCLQGSELPPHELYTHVYVNQGDLPVRGCDLFTTNQTVPRN